jgi:hypothetical protein
MHAPVASGDFSVAAPSAAVASPRRALEPVDPALDSPEVDDAVERADRRRVGGRLADAGPGREVGRHHHVAAVVDREETPFCHLEQGERLLRALVPPLRLEEAKIEVLAVRAVEREQLAQIGEHEVTGERDGREELPNASSPLQC